MNTFRLAAFADHAVQDCVLCSVFVIYSIKQCIQILQVTNLHIGQYQNLMV